MLEVIARSVDDDSFLEVQPLFAPNIIIGFARVEGKPVGVVANQPKEMAGTLNIEASEKAAAEARARKLAEAEARARAQAEARAKTEAAMQKAEVQVEKGAERAEVAAKDLGDSAKQAANSAMEKVDDASITAQVSAGLAKDPDLSAIKINVDTLGGAVTLNGPAPSLAAKDRAQTIAKSVKGVTSVTNLLVVSAG